jgi:sugar phosphate isomerase/epimerase
MDQKNETPSAALTDRLLDAQKEHPVSSIVGHSFNRREMILSSAGGAFALAAAPSGTVALEGYIWQQYAQRQKKKLADVLDEVIPMAKRAGYRNIELNQEFFTPSLRDRVIHLVRENSLSMSSVYVGGVMHEKHGAQLTIGHALEVAGLCRSFGCQAVVHNPSPKPGGARKSDSELAVQIASLNRFGRVLRDSGFQLRVHHHSPEMADNAREWREILHRTDPATVSLCMDLDWVNQGGQNPLQLLREAGPRVSEIHLRNAKKKLWLETLTEGDIDYRQVAWLLRSTRRRPLLVVELAYAENTLVTKPLEEDLRRSRIYAERIFRGIR